jgi:catechol 2,3-dioxygenase-like lactoylglutathione lyase family enzyme
MAIQRMDHVGVVVGDLERAVAFFLALGLEKQGEWTADDEAVGRIIGLDGAVADCAMLATPDGHSKLEVHRFRSPASPAGDAAAPANAPGLRHLCFQVGDLDATIATAREHGGELVGEVVEHGGAFRLCYLRGPEGIILELAERVER